MQRPKEEQRDKQCNVQKMNRGTNNATSKRRTKGQTMQRPKEEQRDKQCNVQKKNKGTNNAASKRRIKGQTMQRPKDEQRDKQCNVQKKNVCPFVLLLDVALFVPLFIFWTLHCLSLCSSFGRRKEGQTMQRLKDEQRDKQCNV
jgi:hypothetical protein